LAQTSSKIAVSRRFNHTLTFSFSLKTDSFEGIDGSDISPDDAIANITFSLVREVPWNFPTGKLADSSLVAQAVISGPFSNVGVARDYSVTFQAASTVATTHPSVDSLVLISVKLLPNIKTEYFKQWFKQPANFAFTNIFLIRNPGELPLARRLRKISQLATLREPPVLPNKSPERTNCPHRQRRLTPWSSVSLWRNARMEFPSANKAIAIPANRTVLLTARDVPTDGFASITVPANATLIFADENIRLRVRFMAIYGSVRIGSPTCRVSSNIVITLYGAATNNSELPEGLGSKGIAVMPSGSLDVHGTRYRSWSRLAATALAGDSFVQLQHAVNWIPGNHPANFFFFSFPRRMLESLRTLPD
jgi:hypothetical protein